jgi:hypothetical protein
MRKRIVIITFRLKDRGTTGDYSTAGYFSPCQT